MTKIVQLKAENVKRIKAVEINPKGDLVVIGGKNGQGKTSILDSIMYVIGGGSTLPAEPLRKGQKNGKIVAKLSDGMIVTRTFTRKGEHVETTALEVRGPAGENVSSPQALLDKLCSRIAFDPLSFSRLKAKEQANALRELVGLDFTTLDAERQRVFDERTLINRQHKAAEQQLQAMPFHPEAIKAVSVAELADKLGRAEARNKANAGDRQTVANHEQRVTTLQGDLERAREEVKRLESKLADEMATLVEMREAAAALKDTDTAALREQLKQAEEINRKAIQNEARKSKEQEEENLRRKAEALTERISAIDDEKAEAMKAAKFPVPGLAFDSAGVTLNGLPFDQASAAEQLKVSIAIGFALNPNMPIALIRDGSLLDSDSLAMAAAITAEHKGQLWIERVGAGDEVTVLIEDGQVIEAE